MKKPGFKSLIGMVLLILAAPALFLGGVLEKEPFDSEPRESVKNLKPDFVFIGDSMLRTRIDPDVLSAALGGARISRLDDDGSGSARWFLRLKNHVAAAEVRPRMVFIFFRDWNLSWPAFRTTGRYRELVEADSHDEEPVLEQVLEHSKSGWKPALDQQLRKAYPIQERAAKARDSLRGRAMRIFKETIGSTENLDEDLEDTFELRDLRKDVPAEMADADGPRLETFDPAPNASFLPHMIAVARAHRLPLCFVRVKRRPLSDERGSTPRQPEDLQSYIESLRKYFEEQGVYFYDFTAEPEVTLSMYADGDHISETARPQYTKLFARKLSHLLETRNGESAP